MFFGTVRLKIPMENRDMSYYPKKLSETQKGIPTNVFGTVRLKIFDGKL